MDWSKAKTIIIVALLVTNIFLFKTYSDGRSDTQSEIDEAALVSVLNAKNIYLGCEIPKQHPTMAALSVEYVQASDESMEEARRGVHVENAESATDGAYASACEGFMKALGLNTEYAVIRSIERNGGRASLEYGAEIDGKELENCRFVCDFADGSIVSCENEWLNPIKLGRSRLSMVSAASALVDFLSETDAAEGERIEIDDISPVYWIGDSAGTAERVVSDTALGAWKIEYRSGGETGVRYISASEQGGNI